ncbi:hypothetical protein [Telluribacter sp. SYSU D00476]|uniref:hypothetical protein n=1 Tax=Telluribacter sp. SYSU D00476 TaxID=2811430 RepID=UPI001FF38B59|nr:hypothetical protein [Telluribacter sp. SYSU D00476]
MIKKLLLVACLVGGSQVYAQQTYFRSRMGNSDFQIDYRNGRYLMTELPVKECQDSMARQGEFIVTEVEEKKDSFFHFGYTIMRGIWVEGVYVHHLTLVCNSRKDPEQTFVLYYDNRFFAGNRYLVRR